MVGRNISKLEAVSGLAGMLCPFPIVGEVLLAVPINRVVSNRFGDSPAVKMLSVATATAMRLQFYPAYSYALDIAKEYLG
ncbi:MAG: hypothetical protein ABIH37_01265 [archaeon]